MRGTRRSPTTFTVQVPADKVKGLRRGLRTLAIRSNVTMGEVLLRLVKRTVKDEDWL